MIKNKYIRSIRFFVIKNYWLFIAFSLLVLPLFWIVVICDATIRAVKEFLDTDFLPDMSKEKYEELRKIYGHKKKYTLIKNGADK